MQPFVKTGLITERMFVVINDFGLLLKINFINLAWAIILRETFQFYFT